MTATTTQSFTVTGMTCGHCEAAVKRAIKQLDTTAEVDADRTQNKVQVTSQLAKDAIVAAIKDEGYTVEN